MKLRLVTDIHRPTPEEAEAHIQKRLKEEGFSPNKGDTLTFHWTEELYECYKYCLHAIGFRRTWNDPPGVVEVRRTVQ